MTENARTEWLLAAHGALDDIPHTILKDAAKIAMRKADHPSKIVPLIIEHAEPEMRRRARFAQLDRDIAATRELVEEYRSSGKECQRVEEEKPAHYAPSDKPFGAVAEALADNLAAKIGRAA